MTGGSPTARPLRQRAAVTYNDDAAWSAFLKQARDAGREGGSRGRRGRGGGGSEAGAAIARVS